MGYGAYGEKVRSLQRSLNLCYAGDSADTPNAVNLGFAPLVADGSFGSRTKAALIAAQRYHGITANGIYGPQTASTIRHKTSPMEGPWTLPMCHTLFP
jgi:peptidoglycan hydrolase-like protein with peptidoglycan-binding domain